MSSFGFDQPEDSPGFLLWQTMTTWQRQIKQALVPYNLAHSDFVIMAVTLWYTEHGQQPTQIMISKLSKIDKMTISKALKKLINNGLVYRAESVNDTRAKILELTTEGKNLTRKLISLIENIDNLFFNQVTKNEQTELIRIFKKLGKLL